MAKGGKRPGAGRPKGSKDKVLKAQREAIAASGLMPLDYMLAILRDETAESSRRDWAADKAAPYLHPKLQSTTVKGDGPDGIIRVRVVD